MQDKLVKKLLGENHGMVGNGRLFISQKSECSIPKNSKCTSRNEA
jgi:hypothetical protein